MKKTILSIFLVLATAYFNILAAQEPPTDIMNRLPDFFAGICSAKYDEVATYSKMLGAFTEDVNDNLELLRVLREKAIKNAKINSNVDTKALEKEYDKVKSSLNLKDYSIRFDNAIHTDAEKKMNAEIEANIQKQGQTDDWKVMEKLSNELIKYRADYCMTSSPHYYELLTEERAMLKQNISNLIYASDLDQKMKCKLLGYTYFPELSYEEAYLHILDHLKNMNMLLSLFPGND
jgi:hypothetical protein